MFNLIKYEFRKNQTLLLSLLAATAALEIYFLWGRNTNHEDHMMIAFGLIFLCCFAVATFAFVSGIAAYSNELKQRSSYLIFMTPNSTVKIVTSKILYTLVNGLLLAAIYTALFAYDGQLVMKYYGEWVDMVNMIKHYMLEYGVNVDHIVLMIVSGAGMVFMIILSTVSIAYDAITISHTLFRDKKWRWIPSLVLFGALYYAVQRVMYAIPLKHTVVREMGQVLENMIPMACVSLVVTVVSIFACAEMLKRKVNL